MDAEDLQRLLIALTGAAFVGWLFHQRRASGESADTIVLPCGGTVEAEELEDKRDDYACSKGCRHSAAEVSAAYDRMLERGMGLLVLFYRFAYPLAALGAAGFVAAAAGFVEPSPQAHLALLLLFAVLCAPAVVLRGLPALLYFAPRAAFLLPKNPALRRSWIKTFGAINILTVLGGIFVVALYAAKLGASGYLFHAAIERWGVPGTAVIQYADRIRGDCVVWFQYQHEKDYAPTVDETLSRGSCDALASGQKVPIHFLRGHFFRGYATLDDRRPLRGDANSWQDGLGL